jgi:hypothetical protein
MLTRAMGMAKLVRITRIAVATINSMSVNPRTFRAELLFMTTCCIELLSSELRPRFCGRDY